MIIFLYGQDTYRSREKLNDIVASYKKIHKTGLSLNYFDETNFSIEDLKNEAQTMSMFKEKKLIILKNILDNFKNDKKLLDLFKKNKNTDNLIVIHEEKIQNGKNFLFKFLKENAKSQEFNLLEGEKLKTWVKGEFSKYKTEIDQEALEKIIYFVGNDLWHLDNEIKKLVAFSEGKKIKPDDVEMMVKPKIETDIFETIDAIALKNKKRAISLIHKHLEKGDNPVYLLTMINFQFRNLLIIKELMEKRYPYYAIFKKTKLHPFIIKKSYQQAGKFTLQELKKTYQKIFQADFSIKTGKTPPELALDLFLSDI